MSLCAIARAQFTSHLDQHALEQLVLGGQPDVAYTSAFDGGDEFFHFFFTEADGVGANIGEGKRFTRLPRADLAGPGEWMNHFPARPTGPNEQSCAACHIQPLDDGAGGIAHNVIRDPLRLGDPHKFIERQTPHVFGSGAVQRLAEEMTDALQARRDAAATQACATAANVTVALSAKGVSFGSITAIPSGFPCACMFDTSGVVGVDGDLVVRPFGWKGDTASLRQFCRNASHREIGMQPVEITGDGVDGDFDGVADEMSIGDVTGLLIYVSGQPRPLTHRELARWGAADGLTPAELGAIQRGRARFDQIGCGACHVPQMTLDVPVFSEPSQNPNYRDALLPPGQNPQARGLSPAAPISYDLTADLPDNILTDSSGNALIALGNFRRDAQGHAIVQLFGDLERHDLGPGLAENIDETGTGASVWLTENLWGCGSTAPYLHDGRATTLDQAILLHGGEAQTARNAFAALSPAQQSDLIAFLRDMVITKLD
jgi:cytochrome c peroxidase